VTDAIAKGQGPGVVIYSDRPREDNAEIRSATEETISK